MKLDLIAEKRLAELDALCAAATQDPTICIRYDHGGGRLYKDPDGNGRILIADFYNEADWEYITQARTDLPRVVKAYREALKEVVRLTDSLKTTHLALVHFAAAAPWELGDEIIRTVKAVEAALNLTKEGK